MSHFDERIYAAWQPHYEEVSVSTPITAFRGRWTRLGNYSSCVVFYHGHAYQSVEHAYQAQKSTSLSIQKIIRDCATPAIAKRVARQQELRPDWEKVKLGIMRELLVEKFVQEPERSILISTEDATLIEGNWWNDQFWGECPLGTGQNWLGRLLMDIRPLLRMHVLTAAPSQVWQPEFAYGHQE